MINLHVHKKFDNHAEFNYDLEIPKESFISIHGKSGTGKTTLLNIIGMLDLDFDGEYFFTWQDKKYSIHKMKEKTARKLRSQMIGFIFQENNLLEYLNVYENIILPFYFQKRKIEKEKIEEIMDYLDITKLRDRKVTNLSGGEKQRVAIARAIALNQQILLADEPTGSLDEYNADLVMKLFKDISKKYKFTIIVVTHSNRYNDLFEKRYLLEGGKLWSI